MIYKSLGHLSYKVNKMVCITRFNTPHYFIHSETLLVNKSNVIDYRRPNLGLIISTSSDKSSLKLNLSNGLDRGAIIFGFVAQFTIIKGLFRSGR